MSPCVCVTRACLQGYEVEMAKAKGKKLRVCPSCARAMRGRFKLKKIIGSIDFACDMGKGKFPLL